MRKRLGQHFLRPSAALSVISCVPIDSGSVVLEVGPGKGALTGPLLEKGALVIAVEKDPELIAFLADRFSDAVSSGSLVLHEGDVRDFSWLSLLPASPYSVVANIPYYLTGSLIRTLLTCERQPHALALLVQKEVAERIVSKNGKESLLSLSVRFFCTPRYVKSFSRRLFTPSPSVDSALVTFSDLHTPSQSLQDTFFHIIRTAFHQKRRSVLKKFADRPEIQSLLKKQGVSETVRAEDISFATWLAVARAV